MTDILDNAIAAQLGRPLYDQINQHLANGQRAEAAIARVRALHQPTGVVAAAEHGQPPDCAVCGPNCWPCPTYQATETPGTAATEGSAPGPCPSCRRADQAGLAPDELHVDCLKDHS